MMNNRIKELAEQAGFVVGERYVSPDYQVYDSEYMQKMLKFYRKVNPKEGLLGMYISCKKLDEHGLQLLSYFSELF